MVHHKPKLVRLHISLSHVRSGYIGFLEVATGAIFILLLYITESF